MIQRALEDLLTEHRAAVIFGFAVPASFVWNAIEGANNRIYRRFFNTDRLHDEAVREIQQTVREGFSSGKRMCTARAPWKTMSIRTATFKDDCLQVPINLRNVLKVDTARGVVRCEPMATMGDLTAFLVPHGHALAVQVEMDDLTVGGLCMGVGIETSSHRTGFLHETVEAFEIVTAEGELLRCTRTEHAELYHALPWSHGTLGFLVAVELKIVPVASHVRLTYHPCHSLEAFAERFKALSESPTPPTLLEGLVFSESTAVIMTGEYAEPAGDAPINPIGRWHKPWFHSHAASFLQRGEGSEYLPVRHYFHRHTSSVFFQLKDLIPFANTAWYRWAFAWMGAPKISMMKLSMTRRLRQQAFDNRVAQDILVPMDSLLESLRFSIPRFEIFPMWICPVRLFDHGAHEGFLRNPPAGSSEMYVDVGIYGIPPAVERGTWNGTSTLRELEAFCRQRRGYQMLYADIFMSQGEFEQMFEHGHYRRMRRKYKADQAFPEVYEKVSPESWLVDLSTLAERDEQARRSA
jgi:delta24-sterol reductase